VAEDLKSKDFNTDMLSIAGDNDENLPVPTAVAVDKAAEAAPFFDYLDSMFISPRAAPKAFSGFNKSLQEAAQYNIGLEGIKNRYLMGAIGFKTSIGTFVHISATKSGNCPGGGNSCKDWEKFFLVFTPDNAPIDALGMKMPRLARAMDIINVPLLYNRSKDLVIDGEKFTVSVKVKISSPKESSIVVKACLRQ
jgi:hypothetical protein